MQPTNTAPDLKDAAAQPAPTPETKAAASDLPNFDHRRNGKVAKLPKPLRDRINHMLEDGLTYAAIIEKLGPNAQDLTLDNISQWKKGGYQDWLRDQFWREDMRSRQEAFTDLLAGNEPVKLPEAGLQIAITGICELLRDLCQPRHSNNGETDPDKYVRVANSMARVSRAILQIQQYRDDSAATKTAELKRLDQNRDFNAIERGGLLDRTDDLFGFKSAARLQAEFARQLAATEGSAPPKPNSNGANGEPLIAPPPQDQSDQIPEANNFTPQQHPPPARSSGPADVNSKILSPPPAPAPVDTSLSRQSPEAKADPSLHSPEPTADTSRRSPEAKADAQREEVNPIPPKPPDQPASPAPAACLLCPMRPDPWVLDSLPVHCFYCGDRLSNPAPP